MIRTFALRRFKRACAELVEGSVFFIVPNCALFLLDYTHIAEYAFIE